MLYIKKKLANIVEQMPIEPMSVQFLRDELWKKRKDHRSSCSEGTERWCLPLAADLALRTMKIFGLCVATDLK